MYSDRNRLSDRKILFENVLEVIMIDINMKNDENVLMYMMVDALVATDDDQQLNLSSNICGSMSHWSRAKLVLF